MEDDAFVYLDRVERMNITSPCLINFWDKNRGADAAREGAEGCLGAEAPRRVPSIYNVGTRLLVGSTWMSFEEDLGGWRLRGL